MVVVFAAGRPLWGAGEVAWSASLQGGSDAASWVMPPGLPPLRPRTRIEVRDGAETLWSGVLSDADADGGGRTAGGWQHELRRWPALGSSGAPNGAPPPAIDRAIADGIGLAGHTLPATGTVEPPPDKGAHWIGYLLDAWAADEDYFWRVDHDRTVRHFAIPSLSGAPDVEVRLPQLRLGWTRDGGQNRLLVSWTVDGSTASVLEVTDTAAVEAFGPRWGMVDLNPRGSLTEAQAQARATRHLARPIFTEKLSLSASQIRRPGGASVSVYQVRPGMVARLWVSDDTGVLTRPYLDVVIERCEWRDCSGVVDVTPVGARSRLARDVVRDLLRQGMNVGKYEKNK